MPVDRNMTRRQNEIKAAVLAGYNKNWQEVEIRGSPAPEAGTNDMLVKLRTAGVNPPDNMIIRGGVKKIVLFKLPLVMGSEFVGIIDTDLPIKYESPSGLICPILRRRPWRATARSASFAPAGADHSRNSLSGFNGRSA